MGRGRARKGVALCWPPAGLQATPNTITGVGRKAAGTRPGRGWSAGQGKGVWRSRLCWGYLLGAGRTDPPLLSREGQGGSNVHPAIWFLYVVPSGSFSVPGPRLGRVLSPLPFRRGQSLQEVEGTLRKGGAQPKWEIRGGWRRRRRKGRPEGDSSPAKGSLCLGR